MLTSDSELLHYIVIARSGGDETIPDKIEIAMFSSVARNDEVNDFHSLIVSKTPAQIHKGWGGRSDPPANGFLFQDPFFPIIFFCAIVKRQTSAGYGVLQFIGGQTAVNFPELVEVFMNDPGNSIGRILG